MSATRLRFYPCSPATSRGVQVHLAGDPKEGERLIYANGKTVIVRNLAHPLLSDEYTEHTCSVTSLRWSPDGGYIASGDVKGGVRVWNATRFFQNTSVSPVPQSSRDEEVSQPKLSNTYFCGRVNDLAWDDKSRRLVMAGEGGTNYARAISIDTGSSLGEFIGHHKAVLACDLTTIDSSLHAITASEDHMVNIYTGPPFRFQKSIRDHHGFVYDCRFSRNGRHFATCGADHRIFVYETKSSQKFLEFKGTDSSEAHTGSVFGIYWNEENSRLVSVSADQTVKLWDLVTGQLMQSYEMGSRGDFDAQQMGCLWQKDYIVSLSLSGTLHLFDPRQPNVPRSSIHVSENGDFFCFLKPICL